MASFLEKLKKGMGVQDELEQEVEEKEGMPAEILEDAEPETEKQENEATLTSETPIKPKRRARKSRKLEIKTIALETAPEKEESLEEEPEKEEAEIKKPAQEENGGWFEQEGQLAIDIYQTEKELVIQSAIAGVSPDDLNIIMEKDVITIKGKRQSPCDDGSGCDYFTQECFWGSFSREIILPAEIDPNNAQAALRGGVLVIRLPKIMREQKRKLVVKESA